MLVLLLGGSAATVIPKTAAPTKAAQTVQLSDEQLDGVSGGDYCFCSSYVGGLYSFTTCIGADGSMSQSIFALGGCN
jgi:hypothetical protein